MRVLYTTDLHGDERRYGLALKAARSLDVAAVVNGGDMYPKEGGVSLQERFVTGFLRRHFAGLARAGIACLCMPGNDDVAGLDPLLDAVCGGFEGVHNIARRRVRLLGREFVGFDLVMDYPFGLKDRCRMDGPGFRFPPQISTPVVSNAPWPEFRGLKPVGDWFGLARRLPTLADELGSLPRPDDPSEAVYVIHMPPAGLGLDVCCDGRRVGSAAVRAFLGREQPALSLHGHIHESPEQSGVWKAHLGQTMVVQPGQSAELGRLAYVVLDLDTGRAERRVE
jgi:Icc-related predicted phosphoesterase